MTGLLGTPFLQPFGSRPRSSSLGIYVLIALIITVIIHIFPLSNYSRNISRIYFITTHVFQQKWHFVTVLQNTGAIPMELYTTLT
ncbi:MAG: hypothetical protein NVS2B12_28010 [Ktedonobacteraceae bacterium]